MSLTNFNVSGSRLKCLTFAICASLQIRSGLAQQQMLQHEKPTGSVQWVAGPAKVNVNDAVGTGIAEITIPEGYSYLPAAGARSKLSDMNNPVPENLLGLLAPASGNWFAVLNFDKVGYVRDADRARLNAAAILKLVRESISHQNSAVPGEVSPAIGADWEFQPVYDPALHKLEWAIKAGVPGKVGVNHYISLLGRHGVLKVTASHPYQPNLDFASLRAVAGGIVFKAGERYADHQTEDMAAPYSLAGVIAEDKNPKAADSVWQTAVAFARSYGMWTGVALGLVMAGGGLTVLAVKRRKKTGHHLNGDENPELVAVNGHSNGHTNGRPRSNGMTNGHSVSARRNGKTLNRANGKRKKHFSYHAFYSDMVMNLTRCNYGGATRPVSEDDSGRSNGSSSGPQTVHRHTPESANLLVTEAAKLIQSQQKLIEGQRKLIEEQSKLIHEKSKLIDVENRVLEKQSEMIAEQQLL